MIVQVTKLCDLGIDDLVCSVGWAQRGTHLAVGTSNGKVQVRVYVLIASLARLPIHTMAFPKGVCLMGMFLNCGCGFCIVGLKQAMLYTARVRNELLETHCVVFGHL